MKLGDCLASVENLAEKTQSRYLLRLPRSKLVGLITEHCPLNKHVHKMGLTDEPICNACGMTYLSAFHLLCGCPSLITLRMRKFSKPMLGVEEYESASVSALLRFTLASGRFTVTPWFVHSYEHFFFLYCLIVPICLFFNLSIFHLCDAH
jgi:hypothetical protein